MISTITATRPVVATRPCSAPKRVLACAAQKDQRLSHSLLAGLIATALVATPAHAGFFPEVTGPPSPDTPVAEANKNTRDFNNNPGEILGLQAGENPVKAVQDVGSDTVASVKDSVYSNVDGNAIQKAKDSVKSAVGGNPVEAAKDAVKSAFK